MKLLTDKKLQQLMNEVRIEGYERGYKTGFSNAMKKDIKSAEFSAVNYKT